MGTYRDFHRRSIEQKEAFWAEQAKLVDWHQPFKQVLDYSRPPFARWFVGGLTNLCYNAVDRHLATLKERSVQSITASDVAKILRDDASRPAIVYAPSRKQAEELAALARRKKLHTMVGLQRQIGRAHV